MQPLQENKNPHKPKSIQQVDSVLEKLGIKENTSVQDKIEFFKSLPFEKFLRILILGHNAFFTETEKISTKTWKAVHSTIRTYGLVEDFDPPPEPTEQLKKVYAQVQQEITLEKYQLCAAKLYAAVVFAHMFKDGNGRLARGIYILLTRPGIPPELKGQLRLTEDSNKITFGYDKIRELCNGLVVNAINRIFDNLGLFSSGDKKEISPLNFADENKLNVKVVDNQISSKPILGNMAFMKFLAVHAWAKDRFNLELPPALWINLDELKSGDKQDYMNFYKNYLKLLYETIQEAIDENPEQVIETLESCISN